MKVVIGGVYNKNCTGIFIAGAYKTIRFYKNGSLHREDGPAVEYANGGKKWCYKNKRYGYDNDFTIESWKEKVKELKEKE